MTGRKSMKDLSSLKETIKKEIDKLKSDSIRLADYIFDNPELSQKEFKSKKYLVEELKKNGFKVKGGIGGFKTSFKAEYKFEKSGPAVVFIAEYDALPKLGHACHHHIIASSSVNTAIALSHISSDLGGKVVVIGTPAEELMDTKGIMFKNKVFDKTDVSLMFHGGCRNNTKLIVLALNGLEFTYKGKAAHAAAAPWNGINALDAVIMLFNSINALRQQLKPDVRIHGNITHGGDLLSIIPDKAIARFIIRSENKGYLNEIVKKVKKCAKGAALQTGNELTISTFEDPGSDLLENTPLIEEYERNFKSLGEELDTESFLLGSSDIGNLSYFMPVIHTMVKTAVGNSDLHTKEFLKYGKSKIAYEGMIKGMKAMAMTAIRVLIDKDFLKDIKNDFKEKTISP